MKLQRKNKYSKKIALGLGSIFIGGMLAGCNNVKANEIDATSTITNTPGITSTPEPTPTPFVRPTLMPAPTLIPVVEITGEELEKEIEQLKIADNKTKYVSGAFSHILFETKDGEVKIAFIRLLLENNKRLSALDAFSEEVLFCYDKPFDDLGESTQIKNFTDIYDENPYFTGSIIIEMDFFRMIFNQYYNLGIDTSYKTIQLYEKYMRTDIKYSDDWKLTTEELAIAYINVVPKVFRINASDLLVRPVPNGELVN